jgi:tetratricopeptide (TPR) repeat protein/predicted Ser/Thr protein kinase
MKRTIACPSCGESNSADAAHCDKCKTPLYEHVETIASAGPAREWSTPGDAPTAIDVGTPALLERGTILGTGRYEILDNLGQGAMGAVYKAKDRELDRLVALKVVQPELAASKNILKRFKQELILARQITHRNVVRIFDIGDTDGVKFITMEFIDGSDLKSVILQRGKFPAKEAVGIVQQICHALEAAHNEGVVHRDLKPQNIMIDRTGRVVVMDFGIAHSKDLPGLTMTGALVGTPEYMSPEQARGEKTDARTDIFAVGIVFYELLTGKLPFRGETLVETMFKRTREQATPPVDLDHAVPIQANHIVMKCLETDPAKRYQNAKEVLEDLDRFDPRKKISALDRVQRSIIRRSRLVATLAAGIAVLALAATAGFFLRTVDKTEVANPNAAPVTVLVTDFTNATGESVFDNTLESMTITALEEAPFVNMYGRGPAHRLLARLENGATQLDETAARKIAIREGISVIIAGAVTHNGSGYQMSVRAIDAVTGNVIATKQVSAAKSYLVMGSIGQLVAPIRTALGDKTPESTQLAAAETYTAGSLEAAHAYALGQESLGIGKQADAIRYYKQAIELDPNLGRAYAGLAVANFNLKDLSQADAYYKRALGLVDRMSEREKYRTMGGYYLGVANNFEQGIETLQKLTAQFPADAAAWTNLSTGYKRMGKMSDAADASRRSVEISPGNLLRRYNYSANLLAAGDFAMSSAEAEKIIQKDSTFVYAYLPVALSALLRGDAGKAAEAYKNLEKLGSTGASLSKMGQADLDLYQGQYRAALEILLPAIQADEKEGAAAMGELAHKAAALAETYIALGQNNDAMAAAERAAKANQLDDGIQFMTARALVEIGQYAKAQQTARLLEGKLQQQARSMSLTIAGDIALKQNRLPDAVDAYRAASKLHNSWIVHLLLGRAYVEASHFPEAIAELDAADSRKGEVADLFDANTASLRYLPPLYYWLGRAQEGLGAADVARKHYERYVAVRQNAESTDQLLADIKRRLK